MHVRAVAGLPLPDPRRHHDVVMKNLVGPDSYAQWSHLVRMPDVALHLYGKSEARAGRKLGHATRLLPRDSLHSAGDPGLLSPL
jgi:5-(carboxyamino)imidazole ribonucleotide synthase